MGMGMVGLMGVQKHRIRMIRGAQVGACLQTEGGANKIAMQRL